MPHRIKSFFQVAWQRFVGPWNVGNTASATSTATVVSCVADSSNLHQEGLDVDAKTYTQESELSDSTSSFSSSKNYQFEPIHVKKTEIYRLRGEVVRGFQRGSKLLGWPTANLDPQAFKTTLKDTPTGVYCGWSSINSGPVFPAVLSIGFNPQFQNDEMTLEAYIVHDFGKDFYGEEMELIICGFLRPMCPFDDIDTLKAAIENDIKVGVDALETTFKSLQKDQFFSTYSKSTSLPSSTESSTSALTQQDSSASNRSNMSPKPPSHL